MVSEGEVLKIYRIRRRCNSCQGQGNIVFYRCSECGIEFEADRSVEEAGEPSLPCVHGLEAYVESDVVCETCEGAGRVMQVVSKAEFEAARRRRLRRGVVLFMLALIPLIALGWAVLSAEPEAVCGSWWYGILFPAALVVHRIRR
jgi:hypothetical protein